MQVEPDWQRRAARRSTASGSDIATADPAAGFRTESQSCDPREAANVESGREVRSTVPDARSGCPGSPQGRGRQMFDRMQRLRARSRRQPSVRSPRSSCSRAAADGNDNDQNSLRPGGPAGATRSSTCSRRSSGSRSSSASAWSAATIFVALRFREKPGDDRSPKQIHGNTVLEITLDDRPGADPRGDGRVTVADDLRPRARSRPAPTSSTSRSPAGSGSGSTSTPTGTSSSPPTRCTSRSASPISMQITRPRDGVIHSFWVPSSTARRTSCPAATSSSSSRPTSPARSSGSAPSTAACRTPTCACG